MLTRNTVRLGLQWRVHQCTTRLNLGGGACSGRYDLPERPPQPSDLLDRRTMIDQIHRQAAGGITGPRAVQDALRPAWEAVRWWVGRLVLVGLRRVKAPGRWRGHRVGADFRPPGVCHPHGVVWTSPLGHTYHHPPVIIEPLPDPIPRDRSLYQLTIPPDNGWEDTAIWEGPTPTRARTDARARPQRRHPPVLKQTAERSAFRPPRSHRVRAVAV